MDALKHRVRLRLRNYDYSQPGAYFVTLCVHHRTCLFGNIDNSAMRLSEVGNLVTESWLWLAKQYHYVTLDSFIVMPNHLHGIVVIDSQEGGSRAAPTRTKPLGSLIGAFKSVSTKSINALRNTPGMVLWQRNYFEHVIRDEADAMRIREYIANNPTKWALDEENPDFRRGGS